MALPFLQGQPDPMRQMLMQALAARGGNQGQLQQLENAARAEIQSVPGFMRHRAVNRQGLLDTFTKQRLAQQLGIEQQVATPRRNQSMEALLERLAKLQEPIDVLKASEGF